MASVFYAMFASFMVTCLCVFLLKPVAYKIQLVDLPGGRKQHALPTPLTGGVAMLLGFFAALLLLPTSLQPFRGMIFGSALLVFVGVLDDFHEISPRGRLFAQIFALCVMIFWSGIQLYNLGDLVGLGNIFLAPWFAIPLTLFGAASVINAVNMMDGMDGLCASVLLIALSSLLLIAWVSGYPNQAMVLALLIAAIMGYLCFNFPLLGRCASCFMGDAGSMLLGFILAWFTISLSQEPNTVARPALMLWIAAIPLLDLARVFMKRIINHRSPFDPGRDHIHHILQDRGFSKEASLGIIIIAMLLFNAMAWAMILNSVPDYWAFGGFIAVFVAYCVVVRPPERLHVQ